MCGEVMSFPENAEEFLEKYSFKDKEKVYTNGIELIPVFRVKQMLEHCTRKPLQEIVERLEEVKEERMEYAQCTLDLVPDGQVWGLRKAIEIVKEVGGLDGN